MEVSRCQNRRIVWQLLSVCSSELTEEEHTNKHLTSTMFHCRMQSNFLLLWDSGEEDAVLAMGNLD